MRCAALAVLAVLAWAPAALADPPRPVDDQHFQDTQVFGGLTAPTAVRFGPNGSFYVAEKAGKVVRFDSAQDATGEVVVDLSTEVVDWFDRGLLGMDLDPNFATNRRMYLLYAFDGAPEDTTSRGTDCAGQASECLGSAKLVRVDLPLIGEAQPSDFHTLISHEWCQQFSSHSIGTVLYGPDGALYAGAGEGANWSQPDWGQFGDPPNPCGDPPGGKGTANSSPTGEGGSLRAQDVRTDGDPAGLDGSIIRVDPTTGAALPSGQRFAYDANAQRIAAFGFRNPFRFTFRPGTHELWVGDVGQNRTEEIDRIPDPADGSQPNFGWPCQEGDAADPQWAALDLCQSMTSSVAPYYTYDHTHAVVAGDNCPPDFGTVISGITFRGTDTGWPPAFDGGLFFTDFARDCIWFMPQGANGQPDTANVQLFARGADANGAAGPVDLQVGPDGALYYAYWNATVANDGSIHRIAFTGHAPHAALTASPTEGDAPLTVHLDATDSSDPDAGQAVHYAWDLDGDGQFDDGHADEAAFDHSFPSGDVTVKVRVTDPDGLTDTASVALHPGNTSPMPVIDTPSTDGTLYSVGDTIAFAGHATDREDGPGDEPAARLHWTFSIAHCPQSGCHFHPAAHPVDGVAAGTFAGPDHELPSHLVISLTATDSNGLTSAPVTREIEPRIATIRVATQPAGLPVQVLGATPAPSPQEADVIDGASASIAAAPAATLDGQEWRFVRWDDESTATEQVLQVRGTTERTAIYHRPPVLKRAPTLPGGTPEAGSALTAKPGQWSGDDVALAVTWQRCDAGGAHCAAIGGADTTTYTPAAGDVGRSLRLHVLAGNDVGTAQADSKPSKPVAANPGPPAQPPLGPTLPGLFPTPGATDDTAPVLHLDAAQRLRLTRHLRVHLRCSELCHVRATAELRGVPERSRPVPAVLRRLGADRTIALTFRLDRRMSAIRRALRAGRRVTLQLVVSASDALGNQARKRATIVLIG